jgi:hypothetical protein
MERKI